MKTNDKIFADCKRYMHYEMPENEKNAFEDRIRNDDDFQRDVKRNLQSLLAVGREEIHRQVREEFEAHAHEISRRRKRRFRAISIAAMLVLSIGFSLVFLVPRTPDLQEVYATWYDFHKVHTRGDAKELDSTWNLALDYYEVPEKQDFRRAIGLFRELLGNEAFANRHGNAALLYQGISFLELELPDSAIHAFDRVSETSGSYFGDAVWYRGMALLQKGDLEGARRAFAAMKEDPRWSLEQRERAEKVCDELGCE